MKKLVLLGLCCACFAQLVSAQIAENTITSLSPKNTREKKLLFALAAKHANETILDLDAFRGAQSRLPVRSASVDAVLSYCAINQAKNKFAVFEDVFRVLKPDGRLCAIEYVCTEEHTQAPKNYLGITNIHTYLTLLTLAGFMVKIDQKDVFEKSISRIIYIATKPGKKTRSKSELSS